jgi:hypothetical protein
MHVLSLSKGWAMRYMYIGVQNVPTYTKLALEDLAEANTLAYLISGCMC